MTDELKRKLAIGAGAVLVLLLCYSVWANLVRSNPNSADVPDGTFWICKNGHHFNLSLKQLSDHHHNHYGEPIPCPTCGDTKTIKAVRCAKCGEYYPMVRGDQGPCPKCGTVPKPPTP
ncbi:MAG: hypothetical protein JWN40_3426 [Phycisphaerales bacterium]|nr:hypothetical protein [Phycisphaerales bacterium]